MRFSRTHDAPRISKAIHSFLSFVAFKARVCKLLRRSSHLSTDCTGIRVRISGRRRGPWPAPTYYWGTGAGFLSLGSGRPTALPERLRLRESFDDRLHLQPLSDVTALRNARQ